MNKLDGTDEGSEESTARGVPPSVQVLSQMLASLTPGTDQVRYERESMQYESILRSSIVTVCKQMAFVNAVPLRYVSQASREYMRSAMCAFVSELMDASSVTIGGMQRQRPYMLAMGLEARIFVVDMNSSRPSGSSAIRSESIVNPVAHSRSNMDRCVTSAGRAKQRELHGFETLMDPRAAMHAESFLDSAWTWYDMKQIALVSNSRGLDKMRRSLEDLYSNIGSHISFIQRCLAPLAPLKSARRIDGLQSPPVDCYLIQRLPSKLRRVPGPVHTDEIEGKDGFEQQGEETGPKR